ncbi:MAG: DegT/DnrJ/EryC1/StrS family aminotransferase [Candidatus Cloacimonetes bacterium]|nr:DegT/DnrJ/EryC1/StrS family aminotransferase [Candidatus Cloacimonadota bacterium]
MKLAINGGKRSFDSEPESMFHWPIVTQEDIDAVIDVVKSGTMSGTVITKQFEKEFAAWIGSEYALGFCNGTSSIEAAMWACGVGAGDEIICPSMTYWASAAQALKLGATVNFCDITPDTLTIDPKDIEHRIGPRTKAIVVVNYAGHPADFDSIVPIAKKHGIKIIEDNSHAQGSLYKGKFTGTIGDIGAMSLMAGKSFAIGEAGIILTNDRELFERAVLYGHYERTGVPSRFNPVDNELSYPELAHFKGIPIGGMKGRMNQTCSAMGRVQLKYYPDRIKVIQESMNYFWDCLADLPGLHPHRVDMNEGSTMGGWYYPQGLYRRNELRGLSSDRFSKAVNAEGIKWCFPGGNSPLHIHPFFNESDLFHMGKPTAIAFGQRDVRQKAGSLPVSESIHEITVAVPWFKHLEKNVIRSYADVFRKVIENADQIPSK